MTPLYLGWQYATPHADPGPPPPAPVPPERPGLSSGWLAAQRREESLIVRPKRLALAAAAVLALALAACAAADWVPAVVAAPVIAACLVAAGLSGHAIWQGNRALRKRAAAERLRAERLSADQERSLHAAQAEHARLAGQWQRQRSAFVTQKR